jgi:hypothetical protein
MTKALAYYGSKKFVAHNHKRDLDYCTFKEVIIRYCNKLEGLLLSVTSSLV